jgi:hypothetical protein
MKVTMTRSHFQFIADVIAHYPAPTYERQTLALSFADELKRTNANFNRARFLQACKVGL